MARVPASWKRLRRRLDERERQLQDDLAAAQARGSAPGLHDVLDRKEEADEAVRATIDSAGIERDLAELRGIAAARQRMAEGTYGRCADCGEPIEPARLEAQPAALRCTECQGGFERRTSTHRR